MDLGTAIAIFLVLAVTLLTLFCLVTKYFNYRLRKAQEDSNEIYSMIDNINNDSGTSPQGEYDQFVRRRELQRNGHKVVEGMIQMTNLQNTLGGTSNGYNELPKESARSGLKEPLGIGEDIYGLSMLRRRLNGEVIPMRQETNRSMSQLRSFRPQKMSTHRSNNDQGKEELKEQISKHTFIHKLVSYTEKELNILQINVTAITKSNDGNITQKQSVRRTILTQLEDDFENVLQLHGFQIREYGAIKEESTVQIPNMRIEYAYNPFTLNSSTSKQQISFSQYQQLAHSLQQHIVK